MNLERARLKRMAPLVNAGTALAVLFALTACGGQEETAGTPAPERLSLTELSAVWDSNPLPKRAVDMELSDGARALIAVAYEGSGVQFFDFDGAPVGQEADLKIAQFATGQTAFFGDAALIVFPALGTNGDLQLVVTGEGLVAPVGLDLEIDTPPLVEGICSGGPGGSEGSLLSLGYWSAASPRTLFYGEVVSDAAGNMSWENSQTLNTREDITACTFDTDGPVVAAGPLILRASEVGMERDEFEGRYRLSANAEDLGVIIREGVTQSYVARLSTGNLIYMAPNGSGAAMLVRDGLSVSMPDETTSMSVLGEPRGGGYPFGVIGVTGTGSDGSSRITFIDTQPLFDSATN